MKNPEKHRIFEVSLGLIDMKNRSDDGKYGIAAIGRKLGCLMQCKNKKQYGCTAQYGKLRTEGQKDASLAGRSKSWQEDPQEQKEGG